VRERSNKENANAKKCGGILASGAFASSLFAFPFLLFAFPFSFLFASSVPVFTGFEDPRYQMHDAEIQKIVADFNAHRSVWIGGTAAQAKDVPPLNAAQVKAHMLQESGGGDAKSRAAWKHDPLQVNVPGDWNEYKRYLGLKKPRHANDGTLKGNLKAGVMYLSRKGFGVSGQPAENRTGATFDGWEKALERYNGRSDHITPGVPYREAYADRILERASDPSTKVPIPLK